MTSIQIHRGELYWVDRHPARGSEQAGRRPALVIQTNAGNLQTRYPNTIVAAVTTSPPRVASHVGIEPSAVNGLRQTSAIKCEQIITISKDRLDGYIGQLDDDEMQRVDDAIKLALGLA